jgi:hypothetical protein
VNYEVTSAQACRPRSSGAGRRSGRYGLSLGFNLTGNVAVGHQRTAGPVREFIGTVS